MSTTLSSVISPLTIDSKKAALSVVSSQDGKDLPAQLFDLVGHIFCLTSVSRLF